MVAKKRNAVQYIISKQILEGPLKGTTYKDICKRRLALGRCYKSEDMTEFQVMKVVKLEVAVAIYESQQV